jgi:cytochrome P450 family 135
VSALPPGPAAPPLVQTLRWLLAPIAFMEACRRRYGDAFSVRFLGFEKPMVMLSDPLAIQALYTDPKHGLPPGRIALRPIMGARSVLLLEGAAHLERRRVMLPPFHGERMRAYELTMREIAAAEVDRWPPGGELALQPRMRAITLEVILRVVFGVSDPARLERLRELLPQLLDATSSVSLSFRVMLARSLGRADPLASFAALSAEIDELLLEDISERRGAVETDERDDVLSLLLAARFEDGSEMSDRELRDQLVTLLLAGHETTATALAWTFDLLAHNPAVLERLTAELREERGERYLRAVIAESLRLRPVVPLAGRRLASELRCEGLTLAPGTDVTPAIWLTHTRADLYPQPYSFRPERFLEHAPATYAWIPFGGGIRRCLGAAFAELEMRVVLSSVLARLDLTPVSARPERVRRRNITFSPRHGARVRVASPPQTLRVHSSPRPSSSASTRGSAATVRRQEPSAP